MSSIERVRWYVLLPAFVLLADLAYCRSLPEGTGLDLSWVDGITRAAEHHLALGREIVFTYGPLGYLIDGSSSERWALQIFIAHVCIALLFSGSIVFYCSTLSLGRFLLTISTVVVASFLIVEPSACIGAIVAVSMLLIDRRSKYQPYEAMGSGVLAGLATLGKFTLGVQFATAVGIVLVFQFAREWRSGSRRGQGTYALVAFLIAAGATIGAILDGSSVSTALSISLWVATIAAIAVAIRFRNRVKNVAIAAFGTSLLLSIVLASIGNATRFISHSLQASFGNNAAMNVAPAIDSPIELYLGLLLLALSIAIAVSQRSTLSNGAVLAVAILGWLNFTEGYVREGFSHIVAFSISMVLLFALLTKPARTHRQVALSLLAFSVAFFSLAVEQLDNRPVPQFYSLSHLMTPVLELRAALGFSLPKR